MALLICLISGVAQAQLTPYAQNFGGLTLADPGALGGDGWLVFGNVFGPGGAPYLYGYGTFAAPNSGPPYAFCTITSGEGGAAQGAQQLVVFSDYNNGDHGVGNLIESNVFQERVVGPGDVGMTWVFTFDAKHGDLAGASTALAFIKTLDPNAGWATTNFLTENMTVIPTIWLTYSISIFIDATLEGQILQFGFQNSATNYEPSGTFYDNVNFAPDGVISIEESSWGKVKSMFE
jgi:hypothetical protein